MRLTKLLFIAGLFPLVAMGQSLSSNIRVNQVGYYTSADKQAVVYGSSVSSFTVVNASTSANIYTGTLSAKKQWVYSNESVAIADFSSVTEAGNYYIVVSDLGKSFTFQIGDEVYSDIALGSTKAYYYQRASVDLPEQYAGTWHRALGHPDNQVIVHASAATALIPKNTLISTPKGWYDAADYNKYIVNSGISTFTFLHLYESMPYYFTNINLNIPESGNNIPDILDEALWNIEWMLTMQDPNDGGVYFKCTNVTMDGWDMPADATLARYVVQKSTTSTLDFAAIMAQSARVFANFESELPGFSAKCLTAARNAYDWALVNNNITYDESAMNSKYSPDIETGEYPDDYFKDELSWASSELYITTGEAKYKSNIDIISGEWNDIDVPSWQKVNTLGLLSLITNKDKATTADYNLYTSELLTLSTSIKNAQQSSAYKTSLGMADWEFTWGSNAIAANQSMLLLDAHRIDSTKGYLNAAMGNMDYLLGRNPLNFSYVSGFGTSYPMNIHHRQSGSDGIKEPVPGFLVGGPNQWASDGVTYPSSLPAKQYADVNVSWATNEVTINWNAPLMYCTHTINSMLTGVTAPPTPTNTAPVIVIDYSLTAESGSTVSIDASGSFDSNGDALSYSWTSTSGLTFSSSTGSTTSFVAPSVTTNTDVSVKLTLSDGKTSTTKTISITITPVAVPSNTKPVIVLDYTSTAQSGDKVNIDASASYDSDSDPLTFTWSSTDTRVSFSSKNSQITSFIAPTVTSTSTIPIKLSLTDGTATVNRTINITINPAGTSNNDNPPIVVVNYQVNTYGGHVTQLDASDSFDPEGKQVTFNWQSSEDVFISSETSPTISFLAPDVTSPILRTFSLTVSDGVNTSVRDISITVVPYKPELEEISVMSVKASGYEGTNYPENILDNNKNTAWKISGQDQWLVLETSKPVELSYFKLSVTDGIENNSVFDVYASADGFDWDLIMAREKSCGLSLDLQVFDIPSSKAEITYNYIKLIGQGTTKNDVNSYSELKMYSGTGNTGSKNVTVEDIIEVYPNPAKYSINIDLKEDSNVRIISLDGKVVFEQYMPMGITSINLDLPNGAYIIQALSDNSVSSQQLIIQ
jgi:endoglucanase